ncbi:lycopene cyclase domain-containing protein [Mucilaginibacter flavus]|uniref:lycopene cyclase domain-containing protein n=1 Tax=Mucilaginibacter flavus TaxID=931504 RepID=UPI0025B47B99|nr:lycopene cyclase domain-containing protein [Mucilaginibacter flavus]MDN3584633.1 lycopene cyclase domain-containing protein [Mucilaginibacter flavus]
MKYTYLLIDFFSVLVPLLFSFHPKLKFYKSWPAFFPAVIITGLIFIGWDMYFTHLKIWGFNPVYLTKIFIGNLPIEELLFFLCIPYACVFTYQSLNLGIKKNLSKTVELLLTISLITVSAILAIVFHNRSYTTFAFAFLALLLVTSRFICRVSWLPGFYFTYLILLLPFLIVNGILTGTGLNAPVVWYNPDQMLNLRILTIPVEDVFYGMDLILLNVLIYTRLSERCYKQLKSRIKLEKIQY